MDTLYIESELQAHPRVAAISARYPRARRIEIDRYTEVFNPRAQNFRLQKQNPALILARKHNGLVLPAPPDYHIGGQRNFYFSHMLNCLYDCRYCFLQGMYHSANYVVFVNYEDFFDAIDQQLETQADDTWFFSGYDCDSLAFEPVTHFAKHCLQFFAQRPQAWLELRTKSTQIRQLLERPAIRNCVVAFSFTPAPVAQRVEHRTPSVSKRIDALRALQQAGWTVGLRFDPLLRSDSFESDYQGLFEQVFASLDRRRIHSVSLGPFRLPKPFFRKLINLYPEEQLFADELVQRGSMVSYTEADEQQMIGWCTEQILRYVHPDQFFPCV